MRLETLKFFTPLAKGVLMRKFVVLILLASNIFLESSAIADPPPPGPIGIQDRLVIEACVLTSEKPHISKHVPNTVNVTGRTVCKGISAGRKIRVTVTLTRSDGGNTPPITKSIVGSGSVIVNVAMPCIWMRGQAILEYTIQTEHRMSNGKVGRTKNRAVLAC
jgi:hypothetical protein